MPAPVLEPRAPGPMPAFWSRLSGGQRWRLVAGALALSGLLAYALHAARQPDWRVLYASVNDKDGGAIVAQLSQLNVPYRLADGGLIHVPADRVHDLRLRLASLGLPKGSVTGFELMDNSKFGMTQFQERLSFQRGLEGELTRSIQSLSSVQSARVHLALPQQNGFFREQQKPSASVLLSLHPGRTLDRGQVAGIVHLVASSVPDLQPRAVHVIDDAGTLLSGGQDNPAGGDLQQLQYARQLEQWLGQRIVELLEPVVGRGNVRAQVSADLDFSQTESTSEEHKPNQGSEAASVRSQQVVDSASPGAPSAAGVPGAASNQPPGPVTAPIQAASSASASSSGAAALSPGQRRESLTHYEVDKTVRVVRASPGAVRRLSAAVLVNHRLAAPASGASAPARVEALSPGELERLRTLVREAIGFRQERGDAIELVNAPFVKEVGTVTESPWWQQREWRELAQGLLPSIGLGLLALLVVFGVVRPVLKVSRTAPRMPAAGTQLDAVVAERPSLPPVAPPETEAEALPAPTPEQLRLGEVRDLARSNPAAVANIVKTWVSGDAAA